MPNICISLCLSPIIKQLGHVLGNAKALLFCMPQKATDLICQPITLKKTSEKAPEDSANKLDDYDLFFVMTAVCFSNLSPVMVVNNH